jgi:hypothetical protein
VDLDTIAAEIAAGDHDGHLDDIVLAVVERARAGAVRFYWRLRVDGDEWTEESVTLGELKFAETVARVTENGRTRPAQMAELNPRIYADHCMALIVAHLHKAQGLPLEDAVKKAETLTAAEVAEAVSEYEVVRAPLDDPGSAASTS